MLRYIPPLWCPLENVPFLRLLNLVDCLPCSYVCGWAWFLSNGSMFCVGPITREMKCHSLSSSRNPTFIGPLEQLRPTAMELLRSTPEIPFSLSQGSRKAMLFGWGSKLTSGFPEFVPELCFCVTLCLGIKMVLAWHFLSKLVSPVARICLRGHSGILEGQQLIKFNSINFDLISGASAGVGGLTDGRAEAGLEEVEVIQEWALPQGPSLAVGLTFVSSIRN